MSLYLLQNYPETASHSAVCLGMFDGVHLGHQALVRRTVEIAQRDGLVPCAFTFDIPPACALFPERNIPVLTNIEKKSAILHQHGIEEVIYAPFNHDIERMEARDFFEEIICRTLKASHVIIGFHYHFGYRAKGNAEMMKELCREKGIGLDVLSAVTQEDGMLISSTAIRNFLLQGKRKEAERMLNRPLTEEETKILGGKDA